MTTKKELREKLRDFLIELEVDGEDYYEYTDSGVWATDKAVDRLLLFIDQYADERVVAELESLPLEYMQCRQCKGTHLIASATEKTIEDRLERLKKEEK